MYKKTLIVLAIAVLIIILPVYMFGIPVYQTVNARKHVLDSLADAAEAKRHASQYYFEYNKWPQNNSEAGIAETGQIKSGVVRSISVSRTNDSSQGIGIITIQFNKQLDDATLVLAGHASNDEYIWNCYGDGTPNPPAGVPRGTVPANYLPNSCIPQSPTL